MKKKFVTKGDNKTNKSEVIREACVATGTQKADTRTRNSAIVEWVHANYDGFDFGSNASATIAQAVKVLTESNGSVKKPGRPTKKTEVPSGMEIVAYATERGGFAKAKTELEDLGNNPVFQFLVENGGTVEEATRVLDEALENLQ